jgi:hypothetical protein
MNNNDSTENSEPENQTWYVPQSEMDRFTDDGNPLGRDEN